MKKRKLEILIKKNNKKNYLNIEYINNIILEYKIFDLNKIELRKLINDYDEFKNGILFCNDTDKKIINNKLLYPYIELQDNIIFNRRNIEYSLPINNKIFNDKITSKILYRKKLLNIKLILLRNSILNNLIK